MRFLLLSPIPFLLPLYLCSFSVLKPLPLSHPLSSTLLLPILISSTPPPLSLLSYATPIPLHQPLHLSPPPHLLSFHLSLPSFTPPLPLSLYPSPSPSLYPSHSPSIHPSALSSAVQLCYRNQTAEDNIVCGDSVINLLALSKTGTRAKGIVLVYMHRVCCLWEGIRIDFHDRESLEERRVCSKVQDPSGCIYGWIYLWMGFIGSEIESRS